MRILIAEDEAEIAKALKVILEKNKYTADIAGSGTEALDYSRHNDYDALILDIMLPQMDGLTVLSRLRQESNTVPVLLLSAKGGLEDRVLGLNAGADDYLPKPFAASELLARVKALTRRSGSYRPDILTFGNIALDCSQYELSTGGQSIRLNNKEFQMLELFLKHPGRVFSSGYFMDKIWGVDSEAGIDVIWTYIGFLRKKLKSLDANAEIKTMRGAGYFMEEIKC